jgi:hypothetical protein
MHLIELQKARKLLLVGKVSLSSDGTLVIVELRKDASHGLLNKNTLYLPSYDFSVDKLEAAIGKVLQKIKS